MRKAQIIGQVFVYVLASVTFALIILFGYQAILKFQEQGKEVEIINLKNELQSSINDIASNNDVQRKELILPAGTKSICFLGDSPNAHACLCTTGCNDYNPQVCKDWLDGTRENVILIPRISVPIYLNKIELANNYLCLSPANGKITLKLQGTGKATRISKW